MREPIDMAEVVESIRNYEALEGMKGPAHIVSDRDLPHVLMDLQASLHKRGASPEKCAYWMHPNTHKDLVAHEDMIAMPDTSNFRGRPIRTDPHMPEDVVLFMAPDAVGIGGKVYNPLIVAYAELHDNDAKLD